MDGWIDGLMKPEFIQACFKHIGIRCIYNKLWQFIPYINNIFLSASLYFSKRGAY